MNTRMTANAIRNINRRMQMQNVKKPVDAGTKGLLLRRNSGTMSSKNEPEAERLFRRAREMMK